MRWVKVVEVEAGAVVVLTVAVDAVVVPAVAADAGRAGWVALRPPVRTETVFAPTAGTGRRTSSVSLVTRRNAPSVARR